MSFFEKMKASIGIGAAKVYARLDNHIVTPGKEIMGEVYILGGNVEQDIKSVYLNINTTITKEIDGKRTHLKYTFFRYLVSSQFTINPKEEKTIPFSFILPYESPLSIGNTQAWIQTEIDIPLALDPSDKDYIEVSPTPPNRTILEALDSLGFILRHVDNIPSYKNSIGIIQEFEFFPRSGEFKELLDEIQVVTLPDTYGIKLFLEIDRKTRGFSSFLSEALEMDETKITLTLGFEEIDEGVYAIAEKLRNLINTYI